MDNPSKQCPKCGGKGFVIKDDNTVEHCDCVLSSKEMLFKAMNIPRRYWNVINDIENANIFDDNNQTNAYIGVIDYVQNFNDKEGKGFVFIGPPGVGKTYLSIFLLLYLEQKHKIRGLFYDVRALILDLKMLMGRSKTQESAYSKLLRKILRTPVLVLDDLGSETLTDYNKDIITYIISYRYNNMKPIVITTNLDLALYNIKLKNLNKENERSSIQDNLNLKNQFDTFSMPKRMNSPIKKSIKSDNALASLQNKNQLEHPDILKKSIYYEELPQGIKQELSSRLGESIASRLGEMCEFMYVVGEDKRLSKIKR
jgi:DNA replication protein DnaC